MNDYKLVLDTIPWVDAAIGLSYKEFIKGNIKLRLVEFSDGFVEKEWCRKGHLGIVLSGQAHVLFNNGRKVVYQKGDIIDIPTGDSDKHKTIISQGDSIRVLFFEDI